jgi:hypothetical protein
MRGPAITLRSAQNKGHSRAARDVLLVNDMKNPLLFSSALSAALLLTTNSARAQVSQTPSVTGIEGVAQRLEPTGSNADATTGGNPHPTGIPVNEIDLEDCDANLAYEIELGLSTMGSGYNLNVWAGTKDCSQLANRQAATAACWPVTEPVQVNSNPYAVRVRMQDIVSQAFGVTGSVVYDPASADVCQLQKSAAAANLSLYFFFADDEGNAVGHVQPFPVIVDTVANPIPPNEGGALGEQSGSASTSGGCTIDPRGSSPLGGVGGGVFAAALAIVVRRRKRASN